MNLHTLCMDKILKVKLIAYTIFALWLITACLGVYPISPTSPVLPSAIPTSTSEPIIHFAVIGDYGFVGDDAKSVADLIHQKQPDFIITTGDNNYPDGSKETIDQNIGQYYADFIYPYKGAFSSNSDKNRFFPSLGNHDLVSDGGQPYFDYFTLPGNERYYKYTWEFIDFFVINSNPDEPDGISLTSTQAMWLKNALSTSNAAWKLVYFHHPPFSSGPHGSTEELQWPYKEWGAAVVLSGHDHTYERLLIDGFPFIINGLGGMFKYQFINIHPDSLYRYNDEYGALFAEAHKERFTFQFINVHGEIIDKFEISK